MSNKVIISEIFESVQGEGIYAGINQLFIRFSSCNLKCRYCDTDFGKTKEYSVDELLRVVKKYKNIHSISLTGGEPLLESEFLADFLPKTTQRIYLETNGTLYKNLEKIINSIDIISMDIKLPSAAKTKDLFEIHEQFIKVAKQKELFLKVVFDENIKTEEIMKTIHLAKKYDLTIVLQPKMDFEKLKIDTETINNIFYNFVKEYKNVRLIPQIHKFLNLK